jgi:2-methylcitrate dehydratase PrpD
MSDADPSTVAQRPESGLTDDVLVQALHELAEWSAGLSWTDVPSAVKDRLALVLFDTIAVARAGASTGDNVRMRATWQATGPATVFGDTPSTTDRAVVLNGAAAVSLEMDEASRITRGHAAAHTVFAILACAEEAGMPADTTAVALLVGHEIASRFGRAATMAYGLHPHGSWGGSGAAAGVARLARLDADTTAAAIDIAGGLMFAAPFSCAPAGNPVRNQWVGMSNLVGIMAVRTARAALGADLNGVAAQAFDLALGTLDSASLSKDLGSSYAIEQDFIKRHAACGYSHAVLDCVLQLHEQGTLPPSVANIHRVTVAATSHAAELQRLTIGTRTAAMFSLPYLVAAAILLRDTGPIATAASSRSNPDILELAGKVDIIVDPDLESRMPRDRGARVEVRLNNGRVHTAAVANARWDPRHHPATWDDVRGKAARLLDPLECNSSQLEEWVRELLSGDRPRLSLNELVGSQGGSR